MKSYCYVAYDINVNDQNEKIISLYKIYLEDEDDEYYKKKYIECFESQNLKEDIKALRSKGYLSICQFGFFQDQMRSDNPLVNVYLLLKGNRLVALDKIYFSETVGEKTFLIGAINFIDAITGTEYLIRTKKFGLETSQNISKAESLGYVNIINTSLKDIDSIHTPFIHKLVQKRK